MGVPLTALLGVLSIQELRVPHVSGELTTKSRGITEECITGELDNNVSGAAGLCRSAPGPVSIICSFPVEVESWPRRL